MGRGVNSDGGGRAMPHAVALEPTGAVMASADVELTYTGPAAADDANGVTAGMFTVSRRDGKHPPYTWAVRAGETSFVPWLKIDGGPVLLTVTGFTDARARLLVTRPTGSLREAHRRLFGDVEAIPNIDPPPDPPAGKNRARRRRETREAVEAAAAQEESAASPATPGGPAADRPAVACPKCSRFHPPTPPLLPIHRRLIRMALGKLVDHVLFDPDHAARLAATLGTCACVDPTPVILGLVAEVTEGLKRA